MRLDSEASKIWAPWRKKYILTLSDKEDGCIFCEKPALDESHDQENFIVYRSDYCFIILNIYPYNNCHLMIVPYRHISDFEDLTREETADMNFLLQVMIRSMKKFLMPDGFNAGMNLGKTAGAGIHEHLHMHLVPRWNGDTNFMPILAGTKVISESLEESYRQIKKHFLEELEIVKNSE